MVLALLQPGATVALAEGAYWGTSGLMRGVLAKWGLNLVEFDETGDPPAADLVWIEPCSNPFLTSRTSPRSPRPPTRRVASARRQHGADAVPAAAARARRGPRAALGDEGPLRPPRRAPRSRRLRPRGGRGGAPKARTQTGIVAAPDPAWLLLRGLKTLAVRVERQSATALELARRLQAHPRVERVRYPGLGDAVAARYVDRFGPLLSFDVADAEAARRVETSLRVIENATSLGGVASTLEARSRWEPDRVPPGLLRLSAGLESVEDLWRDLEQSL